MVLLRGMMLPECEATILGCMMTLDAVTGKAVTRSADVARCLGNTALSEGHLRGPDPSMCELHQRFQIRDPNFIAFVLPPRLSCKSCAASHSPDLEKTS